MCRRCSLQDLGEQWEDFKARTNAGITVAAYQRKLADEQSGPDAQFVRAQAWARRKAAESANRS